MAATSPSKAVTRPGRPRVRLTEISSRAWEHPADKGALIALRQLRGFDFIVRKLLRWAAELQRWIDGDGEAGTSAYLRILGGECPRRAEDARASIRDDVGEAARHYKESFERSQDPLVSIVRDIGGGLSGVKDWVTSRFPGGRTPDE